MSNLHGKKQSISSKLGAKLRQTIQDELATNQEANQPNGEPPIDTKHIVIGSINPEHSSDDSGSD